MTESTEREVTEGVPGSRGLVGVETIEERESSRREKRGVPLTEVMTTNPEGELKIRTGVPGNWRTMLPGENWGPIHVSSWVSPLAGRMVTRVESFHAPSDMMTGSVVVRLKLTAL